MRDRVEVALQVGIDDVGVAGLEQLDPRAAARLCSPGRGESRSCARRSRARRSAPARCRSAVCTTRSRTVGIPSGRFSRAPRFGDVVPADRLRPVSARPQLFAQASPGSRPGRALEQLDRDVIHPGGSPGWPRPCAKAARRFRSGIDLVDQAEPLASFDPLFEGRQHALRPDRGSTQGQRPRTSPACLAPGTVAGCLSTSCPSRSPPSCTPSLHPVTRLLRYYGCSDSSESLPPDRGLPASRHTSVETIPPPTTPGPPIAAFTRYPSARRVSPSESGLRHWLAGSPGTSAESSSSPADWSFTSGCSPPRLATTQLPSASRPESACLERTYTSIRVRSRAH